MSIQAADGFRSSAIIIKYCKYSTNGCDRASGTERHCSANQEQPFGKQLQTMVKYQTPGVLTLLIATKWEEKKRFVVDNMVHPTPSCVMFISKNLECTLLLCQIRKCKGFAQGKHWILDRRRTPSPGFSTSKYDCDHKIKKKKTTQILGRCTDRP